MQTLGIKMFVWTREWLCNNWLTGVPVPEGRYAGVSHDQWQLPGRRQDSEPV